MEREPVSFSEKNQPRQRKIIHCDCDCFYASIEMRDNPALRGKPIAVGGSPERRGVGGNLQLRSARIWHSFSDGLSHGTPSLPRLDHYPH